MREIKFNLNSRPVRLRAEAGATLFEVLRQYGLRLNSACDGQGFCGACAVLVDGLPVNSCLYPAARAEGRCVRTIEGEQPDENSLSPVQKAYVQAGAIQCGFCTPALIMTSTAFVEKNRHRAAEVSREEIIAAHQGHLCRCTGYQQIVTAVELALKNECRPCPNRGNVPPPLR